MKLCILLVVSFAVVAHGLADLNQPAQQQQLQPMQQLQQPNQQPQAADQKPNPLGDLMNMVTGGSNKEGPDFMKLMGDFASMMGNSGNTNNAAAGSNKEGPDFMKLMGNLASMMGNSGNTNDAATGGANPGPNIMDMISGMMNGGDGKNSGQAVGDLLKTMLNSGSDENKNDDSIELMINMVNTLMNSKNEKGEFDINKMMTNAMSTGAVKNLMNLIMKEVNSPEQLAPPKVVVPEPQPEPFNWLLYVVLPLLCLLIVVLLWFVIFGTPVQIRRSFKPKYSMV